MTNEEKDLLLKDLCARLPYGVKFSFGCFNNNYEAKGVDLIVTDDGEWEYAVTAKGITPVEIKYIRYYLRPMSSMTEEEKKQYQILTPIVEVVFEDDASRLIDWLDAHHFDYRGLIEKGLAIEAPEGMYEIVPTSK